VLHVGHGHKAVNLGDSEPVEDIRHERLEAHILDSCDVLGSLEVLCGGISSSLAGIVDQVLCDLSQSTTLLADYVQHQRRVQMKLVYDLCSQSSKEKEEKLYACKA
jgi:hypothetical protein